MSDNKKRKTRIFYINTNNATYFQRSYKLNGLFTIKKNNNNDNSN